MDLQLQKPGDHYFIHSVSEGGIRVVDQQYTRALIVSPGQLIADWAVESLQELTGADLYPIFMLQPEVVLLGTGSRQIFPPAELLMNFYNRGIGVEAMSTEAAARTFNVLVSESRNVAAALFPLQTTAERDTT